MMTTSVDQEIQLPDAPPIAGLRFRTFDPDRDYEGLVVNGGVAHPAWTDSRDLDRLGEEIYSATVRDSDLKGEACVSTC